jgi:hypothetical protein
LFSTVPIALRADSEWIYHDLSIRLDPVEGNLSVTDRITVPEDRAELPLEFVLNGALEITASDPPLKRIPLGESEGFSGINSGGDVSGEAEPVRYRVQGSPSDGALEITYQGPFNFGLSDQKEEYTRGFRETTGILGPEGAYLSGSGFWYPHFDDRLIEFDMVVEKPQQWKIISQGNGISTDADGRARWTSAGPMDEIYVVGGPLTLYEEAAGAVQAQVYLRQPDEALAAKYLTATAQYIEMYRSLIGPYPYQKFALVENFWETGYGMPSFTLLGSSIIRFPFILTSSYPHEILHNWWGNSVFVDYDSGNWAEGLTAYLADHLIQEQRGKGAEYRRGTLQKYRNYVRDSSDFALTDFRSRHSAATEAVGYGKTLMGFHMLRLHLGDETFQRALSTLYRQYRGKRASFADVRKVFEGVSGEDLGWFFEPWVERPGAAELEVEARVTEKQEKVAIEGVVRQVQAGGPLELEIPVAIQSDSGAQISKVTSRAVETRFLIESDERPLALQVDPQFDLFRLLDVRELPPSIGQIFGEARILALLPSDADDESLDLYRSLIEGWQSDSHAIEVRLDSDFSELPADRAIWILGRSNRFVDRGLEPIGAGLQIEGDSVSLADQEVPLADHSLVVVARHPTNIDKAVGWLVVEPVDAAPGMGRKLPHYGKYSYLAFEGDEPTNVVKGQWPTGDSPLYVDLRPENERGLPAPSVQVSAREALVDLPPAFSQARLMNHVEMLASSELEGRAPGGSGLEMAAEYLVEEFRKIGLEPGGDQGSFSQRFTLASGPDGAPVELRNIVGYLPAVRPELAQQSVIVSAHYDHLGLGWPDVHSGDEGTVHPGADDNASGVAVMLELAKTLAESGKPARNIVFVGFSAEEAGRLGSQYFVENPTPFPAEGIRAVINLDTVGRLEDKPVSILGTGTADEWQHIFRGASYVTGVESKNVPGGAEGSDQWSFIDQGIPAVQIFTQAHEDYHRPGDTLDEIDGPGLVRVATLVKEAVVYLGEREEPLSVKIAKQESSDSTAGPGPSGGGSGRRVRFGTVPDFGFPGPGVLVEEVSEGSPAAAAGVQPGDVLVRIDDQEIADLRGYSEVLKSLEPGQTVVATLIRADSEVNLEVTVEER